MKIAVLGHCNCDASQNGIRIAQSWTIQGHNVKTFDFDSLAEQTINKIIKFCPQICLVTMGRQWIYHDLLKKLKENNIYLANWIPDEYGPAEEGGQWLNNIKGIYNLIMLETRGIVPLIKNYADDVIWIPQFFDHRYHRCTENRLQVHPNFDLGFLGGSNTRQSSIRLDFINKLIDDNYNIKISGIPTTWEGLVRKNKMSEDVFIQGPLVNGDMARFYARTKIGLNFVNDKLPKYELALSNRSMKTIGCGCFLLTQEVDGLEDMLIPGKHCETYPGTDYLALKEKIEFFLKNESIREQIAAQGKQHILENYNIDKVTKGFLNEIIKRM